MKFDSYQHVIIHGKIAQVASVDDRIHMMNLVLTEEKNITINTIEIDMYNKDKNFTIDTLTELIKKNPDIEYYYIMGMDQAMLFS